MTSSLYFAYGSNMSASLFAERVTGTDHGSGRLADHRLVFDLPSRRWGGFAANIAPSVGSVVWGRLWRVGAEATERLDRVEAAYRRIGVVVTDSAGDELEALTYSARPERLSGHEGRPVPEYLEHILVGARECGLPGEYIDRLRG